MDTFLKQLVNGRSLGGIYALIALGYTMVYGIVKLINFAHGDVMMVGAYAGYFVLRATGATPFGFAIALVVAKAISGSQEDDEEHDPPSIAITKASVITGAALRINRIWITASHC